MPIDNRTKQGKTTSYTNISDIVRQNRQNRLGSAVQSGVQNVIGQGQQQLGQAKEEFKTQSQANAIGTEQDKQFAQQTIQSAGQNNQQPDQKTVDRFAQFRAGQYQGPTELGNREQLIGQGQQLQGIANAPKGEYGRRGLLQQFVAPQQQYTQGQQRLDTLLLGQTGGQALRGARQAANQFNQQMITADQAARAQGQAFQNQAREFGQQVNQDLINAQTAQQQDLQTRQEQAQKQAEATRAALYSLFSKPTQGTTPTGDYTTMPVGGARPTITQEQYDLARPILEQLAPGGIYSPEYFTNKPEDVIGQLEANLRPSIEQIASEQDKSRAQALSQLSGKPQDILTGDIGGYDPLSFLDRDRFNKAIEQSKKTYDEYDAYKQAQSSGQIAKTKAERDRQLLLDYINNTPGARVTRSGDTLYGDTSQLGGGVITPREGEEYFTLDDPSGKNRLMGTEQGYLLNKQIADQLRQNYGDFSSNLGSMRDYLGGQKLGDVANTDFNNYLRSLYQNNANTYQLSGGAADIDNSVQKYLSDMVPKIQEREALGASDQRLSILDKLQSLIG